MATSRYTAMVLAVLGHACTLPLPTAAAPIDDTIEAIIAGHANYWNVSLSAAFGIGSPSGVRIIAAAGGYANHATGETATTESLYPAGSTDKAFTAAASLRLHEQGLLDLDAPVHTVIDPWLAKQSPPQPTLLEIWGGDATINTVTGRQLLQMRSGIQDYNDMELYDWTLANKGKDYLPIHFIKAVNKTFLFPPGQGGMYSGNGYVMMGMVLSAVTGVDTWDQLDQLKPISSRGGGPYTSTLFMHAGPCTQYPKVVHQYDFQNAPYGAASAHDRKAVFEAEARRPQPLPTTVTATGGANAKQCGPAMGQPGWYGETAVYGSYLGSLATHDNKACCALASANKTVGGWMYQSAKLFQPGVCSLFGQLYGGGHLSNSTSGVCDRAVTLRDYTDLADYSCLNGWTMGNIAVAPKDVVTFYHDLAHGRVVSPASLAEMQHYLPLTMGENPKAGTPYGLGLLELGSYGIRLECGEACTKSPRCKTTSYPGYCELNVSTWGHPGLDWASGMPRLGFMPELNLSFAMGFNSYMGMNTTLGMNENKGNSQYNDAWCTMIRAILAFIDPTIPSVECGTQAVPISLA